MHLAETLSYFNKQVRALLISGEILHTHTNTHRQTDKCKQGQLSGTLPSSFLSESAVNSDRKQIGLSMLVK